MFDTILRYLSVFGIAMVSTLLLVPIVSRLAIHFGCVDLPGPRRLHAQPIPRIGGLAVFIGFHLACLVLYYCLPIRSPVLDQNWWHKYLLVSSFLLIVGLVDDCRGIRPLVKLCCQIIAATMMFYFQVRVADIFGVDLPLMLDLALTVFWFLAITNAFNLIDGLDGLASGLASIAALGIIGSFMFRGLEGEALVMLGFLGACLAFLKYNFNPASIFLGDSGSMFIGFTIAAVSLSTGTKGTAMASIGVPLLAVGVPIFDTMLAVWRRSVRSVFPRVRDLGSSGARASGGVMHFDMDHLHHRLIKSGLNQRKVAVTLYLANAMLVLVGLLSLLFSSYAMGIYLIAFVLGTYVVVGHVAHVELWDSGVAIAEGFKPPNNKVLAVLLYPLIDFFLLTLAMGMAMFCCRYWNNSEIDLLKLLQMWSCAVPLWSSVTFILLFLARTYSRVWSRARVAEYLLLAIAIVAGSIISWSLDVFVATKNSALSLSETVLFCTLSISLLTGIRAFPRLVRDMLVYALRRPQLLNGTAPHSIVVYGAGERGMLYLRDWARGNFGNRCHERVVGLIDDDRNLRWRFVHGLRVFGGMRDLARLLNQVKIDEVIVATRLSEKRIRRLQALARDHQFRLTEWLPTSVCLYAPSPLASDRSVAKVQTLEFEDSEEAVSA